MSNKQSSVDLLATYIKGISSLNCDEIIEQAKAMHKEEIKNAFVIRPYTNFEKYYNETFGDNNE
jgi:dihydrodipicolinate synthase/N-acetylneuraminate lyase